jgi:hypothetical protein
MDGDAALNKAVSQAPELDAPKTAAGEPARLAMGEVTRIPMGMPVNSAQAVDEELAWSSITKTREIRS